jgi:hypothetical protein
VEGEEGEVLEDGEGANDDEYVEAPPPPSAEDHDDRDSLFHTLSVKFLIPLSLTLCLLPPSSLLQAHSLLSFSRSQPESAPGIREDLTFLRAKARPEPAKS